MLNIIETDKKIDDKMLGYEIKENGYFIYLDDVKILHQYEPFIPNPEKSYEENALAQIDGIIYEHEHQPPTPEPDEPIDEQADILEMLTDQEYRITLLELGINEES